MRCTYCRWWGVMSLIFPCTLYPTLVPSHRRVLHIHTHFPWAQWESQTHALNWPEVHGQQGSLQGKLTQKLWRSESFPHSPSFPPGLPQGKEFLSQGVWAFTPCSRVTGVVMAFIRGFLRESGKLSKKIIQAYHGCERSGKVNPAGRRMCMAGHTGVL